MKIVHKVYVSGRSQLNNMAEAILILSMTANIVQFIDLGFRVVRRIDDFQSRTKDVPVAFKEISIQLPLIIETCDKIQKEKLPVDTASFDEVVKGCTEHVETIDNLITKLLPTQEDSTVLRTWKAIGSIRLEKKAVESQRILETYKTAILLHIGRRQLVPVQPKTQPSTPALPLRETCYKYPSSLVSQFIGREDFLHLLDDTLLTPSSDIQRPNVAVLLGMGGQGKTALALEFCRRAQARGYFRSILWVDAASLTTVTHSFENLADHLTKRTRVFDDLQACVDFVKDTIETWAAPWMLVFDNFDQPGKVSNIMKYVPRAVNGAVLVTSRHPESAGLGAVFEITSMKEEEGADLLFHRTRYPPTFQNVEGARSVVQLLGYLPLAIDQAGAYIAARKISFSAFVDHFNHRKQKVLQHTPDLWDYRKKIGQEQQETALSVFATWELSFQQIAGNDEQKVRAGHFLSLIGFFGNIDIRESMLKAYFEQSKIKPPWMKIFASGNRWDTYEYEDIVVDLSQLSLLQYRRSETTAECRIMLHPLIRDWIQCRLLSINRKDFVVEVILVLKSYIDQSYAEDDNWPLQITREVLTHIDTCMESYDESFPPPAKAVSEEVRDSLLTFGSFYNRHGRYQQSERLLSRVLEDVESSFGPKDIRTMETTSYLAEVFLSLGLYQEAEILLRGLLPRLKKLPDSTKARICYHLAKSMFKQGRYPEALESFQSALRLQTSHLPRGHIDILNTYASLAQVYRNQGHNDEAIDLYSQALDGYAKQNREDHPDTFHTMVNLANCYRNLTRFEEAADVYKKALRGNEEYLGSDHPSTLNNMVNLAINHRYLDQDKEAEDLFSRALAISEAKLGPEHPETLRANMNLASMYLARGHYNEAGARLRVVLDGRLKKLGIHNQYTQATAERLISTLWLQGHFSEANDLASQILKLQEVGAHPGTPRTDAEKAMLKGDRQFAATEIIFTRALKRQRASLEPTHNDTVETTKNLTRVYAAQDRQSMAENLLRQLTIAYEQQLGLDHKATQQAKQELHQFCKSGTLCLELEEVTISDRTQ